MIQKQSNDPDVALAAEQALEIIQDILRTLPDAKSFDYGGHDLHIGEYDVCITCTRSIAEAQQARAAIHEKAQQLNDPVVKEHLELAEKLLQLEAETAIVRAEFHNGLGTEKILNALLGFEFDRSIHDDYKHSHRQGN